MKIATDELLKELVEVATKGGSGGYFLAQSFISWYRNGDSVEIDLNHL